MTTGHKGANGAPAEVRLTARFSRRLQLLDQQHQERILEATEKLKSTPRLGKPLTGVLAGERSLRVGDHRILYTIQDTVVWLEDVGHRREIYRKRHH